ncbi:MAG: SseB family protein [Boseongicola sp.]
MMDTPLDTAHAAMASAANGDAARLQFYERFADSELFLLLRTEPDNDRVEPEYFDTEDGRIVLVFDREERLSTFTEQPSPYAATSGRAIVTMMAGQNIGIGLNFGVAPSSYLLPPEAVDWLESTLAANPDEVGATPETMRPPADMPEQLLKGIDAKLAQAAGLASAAYLVGVTYEYGRRGHMLAIIDPLPGAEPTLARAIQEALVFSGLEAGEIDVTFIRGADPSAAILAKFGLRFDLPKLPDAEIPAPPGSDPNHPPKLR